MVLPNDLGIEDPNVAGILLVSYFRKIQTAVLVRDFFNCPNSFLFGFWPLRGHNDQHETEEYGHPNQKLSSHD